MRDWNAEIRRRLAALNMVPERESEIAEELSQHLDDFYARAVAHGATPEAAERMTLDELDARNLAEHFAGVAAPAPAVPLTPGAHGRADSVLSSIVYDIRVTARSLARAPAFAGAVAFTLALGIGAATTIFSVVYGVLFKPLPYTRPDRIVAIYELTNTGARNRLADPNFDDFRNQSRSFQAIAKYSNSVVSVSGTSTPTRSAVSAVSPEFLDVFGVRPVLGRMFTPADARAGAAPTVIASHRYWTRYLGATQDLSALALKIDGTLCSVIGVMPADFAFPSSTELWIPADLGGANTSRTSHSASAVARLKDGATVEQARAEVSAIARRIHDASAEQGDYLLADATVMTLQDAITQRARTPLLALFGAVGFLLLVACGNVANLLLARATARSRELVIRTALGAARGRLMRQFVTEALLLSVFGGALGVLGAYAGVRALRAMAPTSVPRLDAVSVSVPVMLFAFGLAAAIALVLGVFTVIRAMRGDLRFELGEGGRGQAGSWRRQRTIQVILAAQMAMTMMLLVGAGLFGRSLKNALDIDPGFHAERVLTMQVPLPGAGTPQQKAEQAQFYARLLDRIRQIPGVEAAGASSSVPNDGGFPNGQFVVMSPNEMPSDPSGFVTLLKQKERLGSADFAVATPDYFTVLGIPLVKGRLFDGRDDAAAPAVAVISDSLARARWPNLDPIGRTIEFGNMDGDLRLLTIVGVVGNAHQYGVDAPAEPTVYVNLFQRPRGGMTIAMRTSADTNAVASAARAILKEMNPEIPARFRTLQQLMSASLGSRRFNLILTGVFGVVALLLATTGVFGVTAYAVSHRTREIGVRVALGATRSGVLRLVIGQGLVTTAIGVVIGVGGSLALTRTVRSMLFGVTPSDPVTLAGVTVLLGAVALLACYVPARRAAEVDPTIALKAE